ncbi:hypothetical protein [Turneriella parva]|uniref:Uncharacterized protein n=1 Tax=Turneriella parva (strain ATCC BAA-1111 / DSM 21527 / NCTC 11395 / H) TaxID=869212 RepID=I4B4D4_TURPD|nr:hypothetical protein [Turneriella parva]AFM12141.1 hypothetical protein Turpa_1493 [Turneriella parva DSM 21527]
MHNITLIGTMHREAGACNIQSFYQILEKIRPEVIFEELMPSDFDAHYLDKTRRQLETEAINLYIQKYPVEHIPVDLDVLPPESFFKLHRQMHERVEAVSFGYSSIIDTDAVDKRMYGFGYLNSAHFEKVNRNLENAIEQALQIINEVELWEIHKSWNEHMKKRESTMVANIYRYFEQKPFETAVFYIGAAHRGAIKRLIQDYEMAQKANLRWNYDRYEGII